MVLAGSLAGSEVPERSIIGARILKKYSHGYEEKRRVSIGADP